MATVQTSNYLPDIQHLLDIQGDENAVALEVICAACQDNKLDISRSARYVPLDLDLAVPEFIDEAHTHIPRYEKLGIERTVAFPCGHVLGDRCVARMLMQDSHCAICPSCDYRMQYVPCGHPIAPALVPVAGNEPVRDRFPLTMPEGGEASACKECRWRAAVSQLHFALAPDCAVCRHRAEAKMPCSETDHEAHRAEHLAFGVKDSLASIMKLIWPDFVTRETDASADKATADADRRQATLSVLIAMVLSELEDTVWYRTLTNPLSAKASGSHYATVSSIQYTLLGWLMEFRDDSRRAW